jgi:hypothetical protein
MAWSGVDDDRRDAPGMAEHVAHYSISTPRYAWAFMGQVLAGHGLLYGHELEGPTLRHASLAP